MEGIKDSQPNEPGAGKPAHISSKFQEQFDDLTFAEANNTAKLRFTPTTTINTADSDISALTAKLMFEQSSKGSAAVFNFAANPEYIKLTTIRDQAKSAWETALDELRAQYSTRRTNMENAKEDEMAK